MSSFKSDTESYQNFQNFQNFGNLVNANKFGNITKIGKMKFDKLRSMTRQNSPGDFGSLKKNMTLRAKNHKIKRNRLNNSLAIRDTKHLDRFSTPDRKGKLFLGNKRKFRFLL